MSEFIVGTDGHEGHWLTGEEIVRCRDFKYNDEVINACDHPCITPLRGDCPENWIFSTGPDGFCAWGKRIVRCKDCVSSFPDPHHRYDVTMGDRHLSFMACDVFDALERLLAGSDAE